MTASAVAAMAQQRPDQTLYFDKPAKYYQEALPSAMAPLAHSFTVIPYTTALC